MTSKAVLSQVVCAVVSAVSYLCIGLVRSWASTAVPSLNETTVSNNSTGDPLSQETVSWIVSFPPLLAIVGSGLSSILLNTLGRKNSILLSGFIFFTSFLLIGVADLAPDREVLVLAGRAISGLGVGLGVPSTAIYIAECSSPQLRGKLSSLPALLLALGVLLGYLLGIFLPWDSLALVCSAPGFLLLSVIFLPESPSYLTSKGQTARAAAALARLRGISREAAGKELAELSTGTNKPRSQTFSDILTQFFSLSTLHPLGLTLGLHFVQNWCGVNVIVFKTVTVFQTMESSVDPYTCTFIVGVVQLLATGISLVLVDRAGRRPLLIISGLVMSLTMGSLALYLTFISQVPEYLKWLPLALIIGSFIGFSVGFATIPFCIMGELLPQSTRSLTGAISSSFNLTTLFLALKFYDSLASVIGYDGIYWLYSSVSFFAVVLVYFLLPETKGKSLSEIEELFGKS